LRKKLPSENSLTKKPKGESTRPQKTGKKTVIWGFKGEEGRLLCRHEEKKHKRKMGARSGTHNETMP